MQSMTVPRRHRVARERAVGYEAKEPTVQRALAKLREARAELAALDVDGSHDDELAEAITTLVRETQQLADVEASPAASAACAISRARARR